MQTGSPDMSKLTQTFIDLVRIDSPSGYEARARDFVVQRLAGLGIKSKIDKAGNVFAKVEGEGEPVIVCAHLDTVEPGRGIKPVVSGGFIKSSGETILGADDKVAVAAIICALEEAKEQGIKTKPLELIFTVREETDGGINEFDFGQLKAKYGVIADKASPIGTVVMSSPWIENLNIEIIGKTAHAGVPEKGINALTLTSEAISKLKWGRLDEKTTANIGLISGGSAMNSIPEKISLIGEVRSFSKDSLEENIKKIKD
ncbi:M20/M25/M40 family metallo-hydrolase, partial [Candidatus Woesebacteria bacterium]|nr:M20/M25/M40 family metallo-hydrolase [Candidatus Woesebacteria bacterium]